MIQFLWSIEWTPYHIDHMTWTISIFRCIYYCKLLRINKSVIVRMRRSLFPRCSRCSKLLFTTYQRCERCNHIVCSNCIKGILVRNDSMRPCSTYIFSQIFSKFPYRRNTDKDTWPGVSLKIRMLTF